MGQTLTHGIYLPSEGERNCYSGLAANWNAVDTLKGNYSLHAINVGIHVTVAEKETWNSKADASALTAHTGDTTIHVTAEDKAAWNGKADDTDVVHKSGAETITGVKTFSAAPIFATFDGNRFRCAHNSNAYITFRNATQANPGSIILSAHDGTKGTAIHLVDKTLIPYTSGDIDLGITARKWKSLNGINPGALSMPDISAGVDISGYITTGNTTQTYTPPATGWISLGCASSAQNAIYAWDASTGWGTSSRSISNDTYTNLSVLTVPVLAGTPIAIELRGVTTLVWAKFFPCQGNV